MIAKITENHMAGPFIPTIVTKILPQTKINPQ
jgi:hypothetical protein